MRAAAEIARVKAAEATKLRTEADLVQKRLRESQEKESSSRERISELLIRESAHEWTATKSVDTIELILKKIGVVRLIGKYARSDMDVVAILKSAWNSRARGQTFFSWVVEQALPDTARANMVLSALRQAGLLS